MRLAYWSGVHYVAVTGVGEAKKRRARTKRPAAGRLRHKDVCDASAVRDDDLELFKVRAMSSMSAGGVLGKPTIQVTVVRHWQTYRRLVGWLVNHKSLATPARIEEVLTQDHIDAFLTSLETTQTARGTVTSPGNCYGDTHGSTHSHLQVSWKRRRRRRRGGRSGRCRHGVTRGPSSSPFGTCLVFFAVWEWNEVQGTEAV